MSAGRPLFAGTRNYSIAAVLSVRRKGPPGQNARHAIINLDGTAISGDHCLPIEKPKTVLVGK